MADYDYDLITIGAGSGGTRASRVAAAYGARVMVAEEYRVGGTCVIRGCVPKKLLVYGAHFAEDLKDARRFGWQVPGDCAFDWQTLQANVLAEVDRINGAYTDTLENNGVEIVHQRVTVTGPTEVTLADGTKKTAGTILIASGARPHVPDCPGHEHGITSNEAFHLEAIPKRVLIAGAGYIANEFAGIFHQFGAHVIVMNRSKDILRGYDQQIRDRLLQISLMKGMEFRFDAKFEKIVKNDDGSLTVHMSGHEPATVDCVMFATGRLPNTEGLGLENAGVELDDKGAVKVDADNRTTCPSIYAVGDVTNRIQLTPVAIREGQAFADNLFGGGRVTVEYDNVPNACFSHPPIAGVGMTEAEARQKLGSVKVYSSDFRPMKNVLAGRDERALYKMVCEAETDRVVGIHMIGPDVAEIIQTAAVAVKAGLTKAQFDATVALHPTMAEELVLLK
ncbi:MULTISPECIES: glutathione-disulfide reductase [unclassified Sphingomonas]|uniref:glutathione-disulfide reductase n=1 Tax=unclassified Sphingomonas TaxID=196159 RepID=UPI00092B6E4E|nr:MULTISPECIES: glutathione-disulfide reductase [unclassified Sphingomonas]MBN8846848.1 glutathione-disulfide reductase [Sphingomonas sp.]OJV33762.1 MAG: glutathione-disulfide reductase [Sphingomonas sp. 67-36]